jgi:hypothetical protein
MKGRYTARMKAAIVAAARRSAIARRQVMIEHGLSEEELQFWERDFDRYGVAGLRTTKLQQLPLHPRQPRKKKQR